MADGSTRTVEIHIYSQGTTQQSGATDTKAQQDADLMPGSNPPSSGGGGAGGTTAPTPSGEGSGGAGTTPIIPSTGTQGVTVDFNGQYTKTTSTTEDSSKGWSKLGVMIAKQLASMAINQITYNYNRTATLSGDYQMQNTATNVQNGGNAIIGLLSSVGIGAASAGLGGGLAMFAVSALAIGQKIYQAQTNESDAIRINEYSVSYNRVRAGYSLNAGTSGEDK